MAASSSSSRTRQVGEEPADSRRVSIAANLGCEGVSSTTIRSAVKTSPLSGALDATLRPMGFARRGPRWYRERDGLTNVVSIVRSKSGQSVDVELGVFDPLPYLRLWTRSPKTISEADCVVRVQVDALADTRRIWHEQNQEDAIVLAHLVKTEGLRWFDTMHDTKARVADLRARKWLVPSEAALLALSEDAIGDRASARARLTSLLSGSSDDWSHRIGALLNELDDR